MIELDDRQSTAAILRDMMHTYHELSVYAEEWSFPLSASVKQFQEAQGTLILHVHVRSGQEPPEGVPSSLTLDIEKFEEHQGERRVCLDGIRSSLRKVRDNLWELECELNDSQIFVTERRGGVRVPFIMGMNAEVHLQLPDEFEIASAELRDISQGGCRLEVPIVDSFPLSVGQTIRCLDIEFPNGKVFSAKAQVRHMRPFGRARYISVGVEFIDVDSQGRTDLVQLVSDCETEVARLLGLSHRSHERGKLFVPRHSLLQEQKDEKRKLDALPPMAQAMQEIAKNLQLTAFYIKNDKPYQDELIADGADMILEMLQDNRTQFLYAQSYLIREAEWVRQAIHLACRLADSIIEERRYAGKVREAVIGSLVHNMGKPLVLGDELPSFNRMLSVSQKELVKQHVGLLLNYFDTIQFPLSSTVRDIIANSNERLDGSGYPAGKKDKQLSTLAKTAGVIKMVDTLTHPRNEREAMTPTEAYKWIYNRSEAFDRSLLLQYIKRHGFYPVGSLVRFSGGFLAWVMEVDEKGIPSVVRVHKNLTFPDTDMDTVLTAMDFPQIGRLEGVVCPIAQRLVVPGEHRAKGAAVIDNT